jgi:hypothetical protein
MTETKAKHEIPKSGVGYWERVEAGHKPARTPYLT